MTRNFVEHFHTINLGKEKITRTIWFDKFRKYCLTASFTTHDTRNTHTLSIMLIIVLVTNGDIIVVSGIAYYENIQSII